MLQYKTADPALLAKIQDRSLPAEVRFGCMIKAFDNVGSALFFDATGKLLPNMRVHLYEGRGTYSSGEQIIIEFLASVWNKDENSINFNFVTSMSSLDDHYVEVICAWAKRPFFL